MPAPGKFDATRDGTSRSRDGAVLEAATDADAERPSALPVVPVVVRTLFAPPAAGGAGARDDDDRVRRPSMAAGSTSSKGTASAKEKGLQYYNQGKVAEKEGKVEQAKRLYLQAAQTSLDPNALFKLKKIFEHSNPELAAKIELMGFIRNPKLALILNTDPITTAFINATDRKEMSKDEWNYSSLSHFIDTYLGLINIVKYFLSVSSKLHQGDKIARQRHFMRMLNNVINNRDIISSITVTSIINDAHEDCKKKFGKKAFFSSAQYLDSWAQFIAVVSADDNCVVEKTMCLFRQALEKIEGDDPILVAVAASLLANDNAVSSGASVGGASMATQRTAATALRRAGSFKPAIGGIKEEETTRPIAGAGSGKPPAAPKRN